MWIFLNDAFFSIVDHKRDDEKLTVRARFADDINKVFPNAEVQHSDVTDYAYRAFINRNEVAEAMADEVRGINYNNFKNSVDEKWRHDAYAGVWTVMWREQNVQEGKVSYLNDSKYKIL